MGGEILRHLIIVKVSVYIILPFLSVICYAQGTGEYKLFVGEFENKSGVVNPLLSDLNDSLNYSFSRSKLAKIHPVSPDLRSAYLRRARIEQPNINSTQFAFMIKWIDHDFELHLDGFLLTFGMLGIIFK